MKKIIFFMTIICIFFINAKVNAQEVEFYEAESIDGIYTKSVGRRVTHFQKSRFFRRKSDNKEAYCIEPFSFFNSEYKYNNIKNINDISDEVLKKISLIAYYGYNYDNHTEDKWYAVTQLMIWKETNRDDTFYFTDTLNGNRIDRFESEIDEINKLVNNHDTLPSFSNKTINIKYGEKYIIDNNNIIDGFTSDNKDIVINNNKIDISKLNPGKYTINFKKILIDRGEDILFYYNDSSQNLMTIGNSYIPSFTLNINIYNPKIKIEKYDKDNSLNNDRLCKASFKLYNKNMNPIRDIYLNNDCTAIIDNIDIGTYYIKETKAGEGYRLDEEVHKVDISIDDYDKILKVFNELIKSDIKIHKDYNDGNNHPEENVKFDIYSDQKYIDTITTDSNGNASITLSYGNYTFKQVTSKDGYKYVEDFEVIVNDSNKKEISYNLIDYKVKVPDTRSNKKNISLIYIILILLGSLYAKKVYIS